MTNQHTDEMRGERRHTKPEFNGCIRYKRSEYCQPCVAMASNYTYTGESDRRALFHQYPNEVSDATRYQDALREAIAVIENDCLPFIGWLPSDPESIKRRIQGKLNTITNILGEKQP